MEMPTEVPKEKRTRLPSQDGSSKFSITCSNVPESLYDAHGVTAKSHFERFGKITKIFLRPKKQMCVIDYDSQVSAEKAILNAGAYDGFMFDVTWTKRRRKKTKREDDPEWLPDSDLEDELRAMGNAPLPKLKRISRQQPMTVDPVTTPTRKANLKTVAMKNLPMKKRSLQPIVPTQPQPAPEPTAPLPVTLASTMSMAEAASELRSLKTRISRTPDEQRRTLDTRDRILRAWGGTGPRLKAGGATVGTCPDMCPEKERLARQAEYQIPSFEASPSGDSIMDPALAVKQYSRSSADQEMPMCYELRPPHSLNMTMAYLLHEIADGCDRDDVSLADWFHFMWDRCRGIRKDIAQQALGCAESVRLVEQCARFHAHCAARLADCDHAAFDPRLNTDNLTKCLQTLKHMYDDLETKGESAAKPHEAEFRGYVALLNLGDGNFMWEIQQLSPQIQRSREIQFAIAVFAAVDNNNYVRFFRLVEEATYLEASILLRYFNDVRARALARIVKAFAPRGASRYPASLLLDYLAFEDIDSLSVFLDHYGLRLSKHHDVNELSVILDRNCFTDDSNPFPVCRAINLVESKRVNVTTGRIIAGGAMPEKNYKNHVPFSSFEQNGVLKRGALIAVDQGYVTDVGKSIDDLFKELDNPTKQNVQSNKFVDKPLANSRSTPDRSTAFKLKPVRGSESNVFSRKESEAMFSFKPAISSPEQPKAVSGNVFGTDDSTKYVFSSPRRSAIPSMTIHNTDSSLGKAESSYVFKQSTNVFNRIGKPSDVFTKKDSKESDIFNKPKTDENNPFLSKNVLPRHDIIKPSSAPTSTNIFAKPPDTISKNIFSKLTPSDTAVTTSSNIFAKPPNQANPFESLRETKNVFAKDDAGKAASIFAKPTPSSGGLFTKPVTNNNNLFNDKNIFKKAESSTDKPTFGSLVKTDKDTFANKDAKPNLFEQAASKISQDAPSKPGNIFGGFQGSADKKTAPAQNLFANASQNSDGKAGNVFAAQSENPFAVKSENIFAKPPNQNLFQNQSTSNNVFHKKAVPDAGVDPTNIFKSASTSQATNPTNIFNSAPNAQPTFGNFTQPQTEIANDQGANVNAIDDERKQEEERQRQEQINEQKRIEALKKQEEEQRQEEIRQQEAARRMEEMRKKEEERRLKELAEKRKQEELQKQAELKKKLEEEKRIAEEKRLAEAKRQAELKRLEAERQHTIWLEKVDRDSKELMERLTDEVNSEVVKECLKAELEEMARLVEFARMLGEELLDKLCAEISVAEMKAEHVYSKSLVSKWGKVWKTSARRNIRRRQAVEDTPVWLSHNSTADQAKLLRRKILNFTMANMLAVHRGHRFTGRAKEWPPTERLNILELVKTQLIKRMMQISKKHHNSIYWKVLISTSDGEKKYKQVKISRWVNDAFAANNEGLNKDVWLNVKDYRWNSMKFAVSIAKHSISQEVKRQAVDGTKGVILYGSEDYDDVQARIDDVLQDRCQDDTVPFALIVPNCDRRKFQSIELILSQYQKRNVISNYKVYETGQHFTAEFLNVKTKAALKWLARNYPQKPPLEINTLYNFLQQCIGSEMWCRFRLQRTTSIGEAFNSINSLTKLYNFALEKTTCLISNCNLNKYCNFADELKKFLPSESVYPKSYEYFPNNWKNVLHVNSLTRILDSLCLQEFRSDYENPKNGLELQRLIRDFCESTKWFEDSELVFLKIVSAMPTNLTDLNLSSEEFADAFGSFSYIDILDTVVYEKINRICCGRDEHDLSNLLSVAHDDVTEHVVIYNKNALNDHRSLHWWYEHETVTSLKPKAIEYPLDFFDESFMAAYGPSPKRRKLNSSELRLEEADLTMAEEQMRSVDESISVIKDRKLACNQLEERIEEETRKAAQLEEVLRSALANG